MFSKAKVGDVIYSMRNGEARIVEINNSHATYPIRVEYGSCLAPDTRWITVDGKEHSSDCMATYYWYKPEVAAPHKLEVDTPVLVRDKGNPDWTPAHFAGWRGSRIKTWIGGRTSHTSTAHHGWDEWRLPEEVST